jgi:hypothetical protein
VEVLMAVPALVFVVSLAAMLLPVLGATRVRPVAALMTEQGMPVAPVRPTHQANISEPAQPNTTHTDRIMLIQNRASAIPYQRLLRRRRRRCLSSEAADIASILASI